MKLDFCSGVINIHRETPIAQDRKQVAPMQAIFRLGPVQGLLKP